MDTRNFYSYSARFVLCGLVLGLAGCDFAQNVTTFFGERKPAEPAGKVVGTNEKIQADTEEVNYEVKKQEEKDGSDDPVLVRINGQPSMRRSELRTFGEQAVKSNPYLSNFGITSFESAPAQIREKIFDALVQQKLIGKWADKYAIADRKEFQDDLRSMIANVRQALMAQAFEKEVLEEVSVEESDIRNEFNKDKERFIKEPGTVCVQSICFKDQASADRFKAMIEDNGKDKFADYAREESNGEFKDYGIFSQDPRLAYAHEMPQELKQVAMSADKETLELVQQGDDMFWVVRAHDKKDPSYYDFEEIKPQLEQVVKTEKFRKLREERIDGLRSEFTVDIDQEALKQENEAEGAGDQLAMLQQLLQNAQVQQADGDDSDQSGRSITTSA